MARPAFKLTVDCSDTAAKQRAIRDFAAFVGRGTGVYEFEGEPRRNSISVQQRKYWWAVVVESFYQFLRDQDYTGASKDSCHGFLMAKCAREEFVNPLTGEVAGRRVKSLMELSIEETSDLFDRSRAWLADMFHIVTEDPDPNWRQFVSATFSKEATAV